MRERRLWGEEGGGRQAGTAREEEEILKWRRKEREREVRVHRGGGSGSWGEASQAQQEPRRSLWRPPRTLLCLPGSRTLQV